MKSVKLNKKRWISVFILILILLNTFTVHASEYNTDTGEHQILFALDCSASVTKENWREAVDGVAMVAAMLPSNYETAVMAYNEDVVVCTDFEHMPEGQVEELRKVERKGYTNTGLALETALESFSWDASAEKRIVIVSDGEISMRDQSATEAAVMLYEDASGSAADKNVKIDILLFEAEGIEEQICSGSEMTEGFVYRKTDESTVEKFAETYLFDELGLKRIMLGTSDASDQTADISLQDIFAENAKILLTAESEIEDVQVICQCADVSIVQGEKFAVIDLAYPIEENVVLQYALKEKGKINAYLVKEYHLSAEMDAAYEEEASQHIIRIGIEDSKGKSIFTDEDICERVDIYINESRCNYTVGQGMAVIPYQVQESQEVSLRVDLEGLNGLVFCNGTERSIFLELPEEEPEQNNMQYFWLCLVVSVVCIIFVLLLFLLSRTKKKTKESPKDTQISQGIGEIFKYAFSGKIVVYVVKSTGGEDMPPASVNLYKREGKNPFSFEWIRDKCHIDIELKDSDKILFYGGENHTLCIRNNGDATLFNGKDVLLRSKKYTLNYNEKLLMIFNDGDVELEIHYKNIKPSERER